MKQIHQDPAPQAEVTVVFRAVALGVLTALATYVCWLMTVPFLSAFTWAFVLTVAFLPLHR